MLVWIDRHGLDVARSSRLSPDLQPPFDDGGVGDDGSAQLQDEMHATDGVVPVLVGEPFALVGVKGTLQERADGSFVGRRQLGRREPPQTGTVSPGQRRSRPAGPSRAW